MVLIIKEKLMGELWQMGGRSLKFVLRFTKGRTILNFCRFRCFFENCRFMLDGKKVYKSTLVYPFGILMG